MKSVLTGICRARWCGIGLVAISLALVPLVARAQPPIPKPFPKAGEKAAQPAPKPPSPTPPAVAADGTPTAESLGLPIYPAAQFLASYDAGRGQRYYLFGTTAAFPEVVAYYRNLLRQKGELVFDQPATHMFEVGRFREDAMAFPPGVTVKDYSWMESGGYRNPKPGAQPERFPTVIQVVPYTEGPATDGDRQLPLSPRAAG